MTRQLETAEYWIAQRRLAGATLAEMPLELKPVDEAAGYEMQDRLLGRLTEAGKGAVVGWKIGVTTPQMRAFLGIEAPIAGAMLAGGRLEPGARVRHRDYCRIGIECEVAMVMRTPLGGAGRAHRRARLRFSGRCRCRRRVSAGNLRTQLPRFSLYHGVRRCLSLRLAARRAGPDPCPFCAG